MPVRQYGQQRLGPDALGMTIRQFRRTGKEHDVQTIGAKLHHSLARSTLDNLNHDAGMVRKRSGDPIFRPWQGRS